MMTVMKKMKNVGENIWCVEKKVFEEFLQFAQNQLCHNSVQTACDDKLRMVLIKTMMIDISHKGSHKNLSNLRCWRYCQVTILNFQHEFLISWIECHSSLSLLLEAWGYCLLPFWPHISLFYKTLCWLQTSIGIRTFSSEFKVCQFWAPPSLIPLFDDVDVNWN